MSRVAAYIGLGSNLAEPCRQIEAALGRLAALPASRVTAVSSLYRSPPLLAPGVPAQPDYLNAVVRIETELAPLELLTALLAIEAAQGRRRDGVRWGPRTLDLDLLLYGQRCMDHPRLQVPHPQMTGRAFVLHPLVEIAPNIEIPGCGRAAEWAAQFDERALLRLGPVPAPCHQG